ncbi:hypothetical protein [Streptomyces sp. DH10]|nr:hypothetical protein [Streptomyces sp. DH10]MDG9709368.1 hypothetical protein [Streptomyces sp. DH10]
MTDEGLAQDALEKCRKEAILRQRELERRQEQSAASRAPGVTT